MQARSIAQIQWTQFSEAWHNVTQNLPQVVQGDEVYVVCPEALCLATVQDIPVGFPEQCDKECPWDCATHTD